MFTHSQVLNSDPILTKPANHSDAGTKMVDSTKDSAPTKSPYTFALPDHTLPLSAHFSSLLFSGSVWNTALEGALLMGMLGLALVPGVDTPGSMRLWDLALFMLAASVFRRLYNTYLEACYFAFPDVRTQPPREHALKSHKDLCGRDLQQLATLEFHDSLTMTSQFALELALYWGVAGFHPSPTVSHTWPERLVRLVVNHYVLSFGMYWMHRALHANPMLWRRIHSFHHFAKHPLSRNTYEDHWLDNLANAVVGHGIAQVLVPLDYTTFYISRFFRIMESLEKHSGISCRLNIAHSLQQWLPFAQMPHHHDWHHEGHKGCNYTFSSLGGVWDCIFNTRRAGRHTANNGYASTAQDKALDPKQPLAVDPPLACLAPVVGMLALAGMKLVASGYRL
eukprot:m.206747 g.206747  ORF g.206747 m.206747 type:complete len:394 (-) comp23455_c0_seq1:496-1677(-)